MKHTFTLAIVWITLMLALAPKAFSQDPNFYIFLCFGQSNMEGQGPIEAQDQTVNSRFQLMQAVTCTNQPANAWRTATPPIARCNTKIGPSDYFGREMIANLPANVKIGIVHVSIAGSKIEIFDKANYQNYLNGLASSDQYIKNIANEYGGNPYAKLVALAKLAQKDGVIKGILLHQGESNTGDQAWPTKVKGVYTNLLTDLGLTANNVPLLAGQVVDAAHNGLCASMNTIINSLPNTIPTAHVISSSGLGAQSDNLHFTTASYRTLGQRYAQMMLSLLPAAPAGSAPVVSLTGPTTTSFTAPASITITATASDADGTISNVKFYNGTNLLNTVSTSPYTYSWTNVAAGTYSITAVATDNSGTSTTSTAKSVTVTTGTTTTSTVLGKCKGKYFGNIIANNVPGNYTTYWNQVTSENASKWGSVEGSQGNYNFSGSDVSYNWAKNNGGLFKYHNFVWGAQTPGYVSNTSTPTATITTGVQNYIKACSTHYAPMGGLKMIDVLNEPVNTAMPGNLKAALTAGYKAEPANANDLNNPYGWVIWPFQLARKYFPDATLLINEYNVEMNWNNCRAPYIDMVNAVKNAPNLTDGKKNLIDGVGLQCHGIDNLTAANFKACIDEIWNKTGVAIHITEFDQAANPNEAKQTAVYTSLIPVAWEHPHVAGITLWGYIQGTTWINGNGTAGAGGTDSGIMYSNGNPRPAMTWLQGYMAGRPSLSCCPAPAPFGDCVNVCTTPAPTVPAAILTYDLNATATQLTATGTALKWYTVETGGTALAAAPTPSTTAAGKTVYYVGQTLNGCEGLRTSVTINVTNTYKIFKVGVPITVDGTIDAVWNNASVLPAAATKLLSGTVTNAADLSGNFKALWDDTYLYVLADVTDEKLVNESTNVYDDDAVEVYIDINNDKATTYGANDGQYSFGWNDGTTVGVLPTGRSTTGITYMAVARTGGYIVEARIPWTTLQGNPAIGQLVGVDFMVNDDDDNGARDGKLSWNAAADNAWQDPSLFGTAILQGLLICTPPSAPTVIATVAYCQGATATQLTATGTALKWYADNTTTTALASAPTPTTSATGTTNYFVSQSANGCESPRAQIAVTVNALPTAAITAATSTTFCQGGSVVLTASAGSSYVWKNGTTQVGTNSTFTATTAGSYTVEVTNANNCKATSTATVVTVNALPSAPTVTATVAYCQGATATQLTATGTSLKWYADKTTTTALASAPTPSTTATGIINYFVSQTTNGCESPRAQIGVTVHALPTATITVGSATTFCQGGSVVLTASAGSSYVWKNGTTQVGTGATYSAIVSGSYTVEVTNGNNCKATSAATVVTVSAPATASISTTTPTTFCQGGSVVLTASAGSSYVWKNGTTQVGTNSTFTATTSGSYTVEVTNANNCKATSAATVVTVSAPATASISTTTPTTFCQGGSVVLTASAGSSYVWKNGTTQVGTNSTFTATTSGSYTVEVTNANNCKATSAATVVTVSAPATASISTTTATTFCQGGSVVLTASAGSSYVWKNGTRQVGTNSTFTATTAGSYTVEVTNAGGCTATSTATVVTVSAPATASISTTTATTFCQGGSVVLTASAGSSYVWKNGSAQVGTNSTFTATTAGLYTVEVTNAGGCTATSTATVVTVSAPATASISTTTSTTFCQGGSVVLTSSSGSSYVWKNGTTQVGTNSTFTATTAGSYTVEVTNAGGCTSTSSATVVVVNALPTATITATGSTTIPAGGSVTLNANTGSGLTYKWLKGSAEVGTGASYVANAVGSYVVEVTNGSGCKATSLATDVNSASNQPSVITITSPTANATIVGTITITVNASDPDGNITLVEYLDGDEVIGTSTSQPYSYDWTNPSSGSHVITVRVTDSNGGITTSAPVTITSNSTATGVNSSTSISASVYPNPSSGVVYVETDMDLSNARFSIINVLGEEAILSPSVNTTGARLDVSSLADGAYILIITEGASVIRKKITVIK